MVDWYIILVPLLLLPVIGLLRFIGCNQVWGLNQTIEVTDSTDVNCGGPAIDPFRADPDNGGTHTDYFMSQLDAGQVQSYTDIKLVDTARGADGLYLFWIGSGRIQLNVQTGGGSTGINNVVNGVFFR